MSVRRRNGRWIAQTYDPQTRQKVWVGTYDSKREAKIAEGEAWKGYRKRKREGETCDGFAGRWVTDYPRRRESTNIRNAQSIKHFAKDFQSRPLDDIDRVEARSWALQHRSLHPIVQALFSDAVRDGLCAENPFSNMRLTQSRGRSDLVVPTEEQVAQMIQAAREIHDYGDFGRRVLANMIQTAAYSGLRPGEIGGLRWGDIDFANRTLTVERQFNHHTRTFTPPKNGLTRTVFLTPQASDALRETARVREEVFSAPKGGIFHGGVSSVYFKPAASAIGRPDLTPHCLRHFYGTHLALLGLGPIEIAQALGHTDGGKLAMVRYVHMTERDARHKIAQAFGSNVRDFRVVSGASREATGA